MFYPFAVFEGRSGGQVVLGVPKLVRVLGRSGAEEAHVLELPLRLRLHPLERLAHRLQAFGEPLHLHPDVRLELRASIPLGGTLALPGRLGRMKFGVGELVDHRFLVAVGFRVLNEGGVGFRLQDTVNVVLIPGFLRRCHLRVGDEVEPSVRGLDLGELLQAGVLADFELNLGF